jgi:hypothetical protein
VCQEREVPRQFAMAGSKVVDLEDEESMWCHCRIWCSKTPSNKPLRPTPSITAGALIGRAVVVSDIMLMRRTPTAPFGKPHSARHLDRGDAGTPRPERRVISAASRVFVGPRWGYRSHPSQRERRSHKSDRMRGSSMPPCEKCRKTIGGVAR